MCACFQLSDINRQSVQHLLKEADSTYTTKPVTSCPVMAHITSTRVPVPPKMPPTRPGVNTAHMPSPGGSTFRPPSPPPSPGRKKSTGHFFSAGSGSVGGSVGGGLEGGDGGREMPRTPRRVRLLNFWARTRIIQRAMMVRHRFVENSGVISRIYQLCWNFVKNLINRTILRAVTFTRSAGIARFWITMRDSRDRTP